MATGTTAKEVKAPEGSALTTQVMEIDAATAQEWLKTKAPNRPLSRVNMENLIRAMEEDRWHTDGSPIKFNTKGQLIDGQHRLSAIVQTDRPQTFLVIWGVADEAMTTLDTGKSRNRADVLAIHDPEARDVNNVSATATIMRRWSRGIRNNKLRNEYVSNDELVAYYDENKEAIYSATKHGKKLAKHMGAGSQQAFALCFWLFEQIDPEDAEFFWDRLTDGQGLESGNPIYALREMLRREAAAAHTRDRMRADVVIALVIKAWNAFRDGEEITLLRFKVGGAHPEKFPEPK